MICEEMLKIHSQPFWGQMVASVGAGPSPIPHKNMNSANLSDAIRFCLQPETKRAARDVATQMRLENGVKAAVKSFHRHLPKTLPCDILPELPASWLYKSGGKKARLSRTAASCLARHGKLSERKLQHLATKSIVIDNQRWDPVTAILSASLQSVSDFGGYASGVVAQPYKVYRQQHRSSSENSEVDARLEPDRAPHTSTIKRDNLSLAQPSLDPKSRSRGQNPDKAIAIASVRGVGRLLTAPIKAGLVDIPLAAAEGMHAVSRTNGDSGYRHGVVSDWKSGSVVAAKHFGHGVYEGCKCFMQSLQ